MEAASEPHETMNRTTAIKSCYNRATSFAWALNSTINRSILGRIFRLKGSGHVSPPDSFLSSHTGNEMASDQRGSRANPNLDTSPTRFRMPTSVPRSALD